MFLVIELFLLDRFADFASQRRDFGKVAADLLGLVAVVEGLGGSSIGQVIAASLGQGLRQIQHQPLSLAVFPHLVILDQTVGLVELAIPEGTLNFSYP
jgi:hypothetical protein